MTLNEITGILAHEVAHIRSNDGCAMRWATVLHQCRRLEELLQHR